MNYKGYLILETFNHHDSGYYDWEIIPEGSEEPGEIIPYKTREEILSIVDERTDTVSIPKISMYVAVAFIIVILLSFIFLT